MTDHWNLYEDGSFKGPVAVNSKGSEDPLRVHRGRARARLAEMRQDETSAIHASKAVNRTSHGPVEAKLLTDASPDLGAAASSPSADKTDCNVRARARAAARAAFMASKALPDGMFGGVNDANAQYRSRLASGCGVSLPTLESSCLVQTKQVGWHRFFLPFNPYNRSLLDDCALEVARNLLLPTSAARANQTFKCVRPTKFYGGSFDLERTIRASVLDWPEMVVCPIGPSGVGKSTFIEDIERAISGTSNIDLVIVVADEPQPSLDTWQDRRWVVRDGGHRIWTKSYAYQRQFSAAIEMLNAVMKTREAILRHFDAPPKRDASSLPTPKYMAEAGNDLFETALAVAVHPSRPLHEICDALGDSADKTPESVAAKAKTLVNIGYAYWTGSDQADRDGAIVLTETGKRAVSETLSELSATAAMLQPNLAHQVDALSQATAIAAC